MLFANIFCAFAIAVVYRVDAASIAPPKILFQPAEKLIIDMALAAGKATFTVALDVAPKAAVTVYLETADNLYLDKCSVIVTPENWKAPQVITATVSRSIILPMNTVNRTSLTSVIAARVDWDKCEMFVNARLNVRLDFSAGRTCTSVGDPHFKLFDGFTQDYQVRSLILNPWLNIRD
jgi:hypothetical protein